MKLACSAVVALGMFSRACATGGSSPLAYNECANPDALLAKLVEPLDALRAKGCAASPDGRSECDRLRREIERLALICGDHPGTLMASAVGAYEEHRPAKAQQYLDQLLAQPGSHPDGAVLRARIAMEEGNVPYARRLLEQQIRLAPDHAALHETYGGVLYLARQFEAARAELARAGTLGSPRWRVAYDLGLVEEAEGRLALARQYYAEALEGNPGWPPAQSRLDALKTKDDARQQ